MDFEQKQGRLHRGKSEAIFEPVEQRIKRDKKYVLMLYHATLRYRQPKKRVSKHRISLKYRFGDEPVYTYNEIDKFDSIRLTPLRNSQWYTRFMNKCRMTYALM